MFVFAFQVEGDLPLLCLLLREPFFSSWQNHPYHEVKQPTRNHAKYIGLCVLKGGGEGGG